MKDNEGNDLPTGEVSVGSRLGDLSELPDELTRQLKGFAPSLDEQNVVSVLDNQLGGSGSIDEILVALYRLEDKVHERKTLAARITRMVKKGTLYSVEGPRGVYRTNTE